MDQPRNEQPKELDTEARFTLNEYIYGNSQSVNGWKGALNFWMVNEHAKFIIFLYNIVTVGPHATLEIGEVGLVCDVLRVHATGKVRIIGKGPTKIDTGTYERFY